MKVYFCCRKETETVNPQVFVLGGLERIWLSSNLLSREESDALLCRGNWRAIWLFRRCEVRGILFQSKKYLRTTARNNYTAVFKNSRETMYGSIQCYAKVEEHCENMQCDSLGENRCNCKVNFFYFAIMKIIEKHPHQFVTATGKKVIAHIVRVISIERYIILTILFCCIHILIYLASLSLHWYQIYFSIQTSICYSLCSPNLIFLFTF